MKNEEDKLSEITVTDDEMPVYPDFNEEHDKEIKEKNKEINSLKKRLWNYDALLFATWAIIIPLCLGLLVNDSFKGCNVEKQEISIKGK